MAKSTKSKSKVGRVRSVLRIPSSLLAPIAEVLSSQLKKLEARRQALSGEDPFADTDRVTNNAAIDAEAAEQFGHARVEAMKKEIDRKIVQIRKALTRIKIGKYGICENCGKMIDTDRLMVYPEATLCVECERKREK